MLSGGNIDPLLLLRVSGTAWPRPAATCSFRVRVPDRPGSLARCSPSSPTADANVLEVEHERTGAALHVDEVEVAAAARDPRRPSTARSVLAALRGAGYPLVFG